MNLCKNQNFRFMFFTLTMLSLTGCTFISQHIISNPKVYFSDPRLLDISPDENGFKKEVFCSATRNECVHYLRAPAFSPKSFPENDFVFYNIHAVGNGVENEFSYRVHVAEFNRFSGTVILLHGFGASKEAMIATSIYFRGLGMDVIMPDMFGHGDSQVDFSLAMKEQHILSLLLADMQIESLPKPVLAVGHSMGSLIAINLLQNSDLIQGAVLLGPPTRIDVSASAYIKNKWPWFHTFVSDEFINEAVTAATNDKNIKLEDTDLIKIIPNIAKPIFLMNSDVDNISPPSYFSALNGNNIQHYLTKQRSHASLVAFTLNDTMVLEKWLKENFIQRKDSNNR